MHPRRALKAPLATVFLLCACSMPGGYERGALPGGYAPLESRDLSFTPQKTPLRHIVVVIQENRTFDDFFATYPGADGTTTGKLHNGKVVKLRKIPLEGSPLSNGWSSFTTAYDGGKMDGFDLDSWGGPGKAGLRPYTYVDPSQIKPYWDMARQYVLGDHMFQGQGSGSFTAHQELIAGGEDVGPKRSLIDWPAPPHPGAYAWGCDAPKGTVTSLITRRDEYLDRKGPFPCLTYESLAEQLDAHHLTWRYYSAPVVRGGAGEMWNAFDAIKSVRYGSDWKNDISTPSKTIFSDLVKGKLANVTWVTPSVPDSDHEHAGPDRGPSWVAQVVDAIGRSPDWDSTAIIVVWDDWGGHYDHVPPRQLGFGNLGFRVPLLIVSPYVHAGQIAHTQYEFGSVLKFIEQNWGLHPMQAGDQRATSIGGIFDFRQKPRPFTPIQSALPRSFFENEPVSNLPGDGE